MSASDQRIVDEFGERHRVKGDQAICRRRRFQWRGEAPIRRKPQTKLDGLLIGRRAFRVDDTGVPVDHAEGGSAVAVYPGPARAGGLTDRIQFYPYRRCSVRDSNGEAVHVHLVPSPRDHAAIGSLDAQTGDILDPTLRAMRAGKPLRVPQPQRTRFAWDVERGVEQPPRQFAGVHIDGDGRWIGGRPCGDDDEETHDSNCGTQECHVD
jgi:hypothetical protein